MTLQRILWIQALIALALVLLIRFGNVDYTSNPNYLNGFIFAGLAFYSLYLFPIIAILRLLYRKPDELTDFEITWSIIAGIMLYLVVFLAILPSIQ
ncbi:MAG: hypothetical protein CME32_19115 [Gimesia sp.]|nr:hypothetical protein [Gimesia sp.]